MKLNPYHAFFRFTPFPVSGVLGSGTANEIAYFSASTTIASLTTATYPSLTELSYVKGVTSAIQTQIDAKAPTASPTFTGTVTIPTPFTLGAVSVTSTGTQLNYLNAATGTTGTTTTNLVFSTSPTLVTPLLGTPTSGTLTNCTGLPVAGITASTVTALGVGSLELGHATDTTLSRSAAGVLAVESVVVPTTNPRVVSAASYTTDTGTSLNMDNLEMFIVTAQAGALLFNSPGGTLAQGRSLVIRIKDDGTARALTWNAVFRAMGTALPSTTVLSKTLYLGFYYNSTDTKWDLVASAQEA